MTLQSPAAAAAAWTGNATRRQREGLPSPSAAARESSRRQRERLAAAAGAARTTGTHTAAASSWTLRSTGLSGLSATGTSHAARTGRTLIHVDEVPLVVMVAPLVQADRFVLALAADAHDAAGHAAAAEHRPRRRGRLPGETGGRRAAAPGLRTRCSWRLRLTDLPRYAGGTDQLEVVTSDRILEFSAQEAAVHEQVHAGGGRLGARLVEPERADVLLSAPDELFFLLALRFVAPDRQRGRHQHRHHRHRDEQRGHRVAGRARRLLTRCTLTP
jgi:hypothetical protein